MYAGGVSPIATVRDHRGNKIILKTAYQILEYRGHNVMELIDTGGFSSYSSKVISRNNYGKFVQSC